MIEEAKKENDYASEVKAYDEMIKRCAPRCHFKPMKLDWGEEESWWECSHCGHTKSVD